jgi:1-acyl-sn-glycerol-3-phosphate acyltransferase/nucleoside-diphosphate-sugar epimerase
VRWLRPDRNLAYRPRRGVLDIGRPILGVGRTPRALKGRTSPVMPLSVAPFEAAPTQLDVTRVGVVLDDVSLQNQIVTQLRARSWSVKCDGQWDDSDEWENTVLVYGPDLLPDDHMTPDLEKAKKILGTAGGVGKLIVLSSAFVYGASPRNPGLLSESSSATVRVPKGGIAARWLEFESLARNSCGSRPTILRLAPVLSPTASNYVSRLLLGRVAVSLAGHDPSIQMLSLEDAARAVCCAVGTNSAGIYNVAPNGVIPLGAALRSLGIRRLAIPRTLFRAASCSVRGLRGHRRRENLDYIRYSWTISNQRIAIRLGFTPLHSSHEALQEFVKARSSRIRQLSLSKRTFDDFGMDPEYIAAYQRTLFAFLANQYWRIEVRGTNHIPQAGRAVLLGVHRGFMPWDGVMALHVVVRKTGRYPRFLTHPGLFRFPFLFNFMTKLGGVVACRQNAEHILERDELLGVFPEGIHGAFSLYRDAYRLHDFHGDSVIKVALRHRAPIIPFVTVGSAEIFPIVGKINSRLWKRHTDWPFIPITATPPFLPLPSKWHTRFLAPIHIEREYPPEEYQNAAVVRLITQDVRTRMQAAMDKMRSQRRSIFFGSIFQGEVE